MIAINELINNQNLLTNNTKSPSIGRLSHILYCEIFIINPPCLLYVTRIKRTFYNNNEAGDDKKEF